ncbi:MBL fold metallo-hydrolase [Krasilnikovia sp. M28-CT-15]|uniref:MBL fold metallo-hydrolase n=1 Tax=Krasilnikovia sp. M28-CT-15 TaxID=3373540 RepID=UPI003876A887
MLIQGFAAGGFETNCYLLAAGAGGPCVIVDPGQQAAPGVADLVRRHRLEPVAVLVTHGHMDHTWDVVPVCAEYRIPVYVHERDRPMLTDPWVGLPADFPRELLAGYPGAEPADVQELAPGKTLGLGGLEIDVIEAQGHTFGSVMFAVGSAPADPGEHEHAPVLLTGDTLLADALGRALPPIGDPDRLAASAAAICRPLPDDTRLLPGHGPTGTIGAARRSIAALRV